MTYLTSAWCVLAITGTALILAWGLVWLFGKKTTEPKKVKSNTAIKSIKGRKTHSRKHHYKDDIY